MVRRAWLGVLVVGYVLGWVGGLCAAAEGGWTERRVDEAGVHGEVFVHGGEARPGFLCLGGSEGGAEGARELAVRVADEGYNALALAYFGKGAARKSLVEVPVEDFGKGIEWLKGQGFARGGRVGVIGGSKGAEAALLIGCLREDVGVVVAYAPTHVVWEGITDDDGAAESSWSAGGAALPFVPYVHKGGAAASADYGWDLLRDLHVASLAVASPELLGRAAIPVEKMKGSLLMFSGGRDLIWPSTASANAIESRLKARHSTIVVRNVVFPKAGHKFGKGMTDLGGTEEGNVAAEREAGEALRAFLKREFPVGGNERR